MRDITLSVSIVFLLILSIFVLNSIAPSLFPGHFGYLFFSIIAYLIFSQLDFDIVAIFGKHLYVISIILLLITLIIGAVTRGTLRWIPIGPVSLQPAEIVRPFLLVFFAGFMTSGKLYFKKMIVAALLMGLPVGLILIQPSLGVSILTMVGFLGVLLASSFNKKYILFGFGLLVLLSPVFYQLMAPYQKERIKTFINPSSDPLDSGYNSLQSTIAAGSGKFLGLGLGHGSQTQLSFLPEKQTDFIFAATAEELGFLGSGLMLTFTFLILFRLIIYMENSVSPQARAYLAGFFLTYLTQVFVHVGMNMGILPVTGVPYPLVSAGGSSLLATMIGLGIATRAYKGRSSKGLI